MKTHSYSYSVEIDSQISVHVALAILYYACSPQHLSTSTRALSSIHVKPSVLCMKITLRLQLHKSLRL